MSRYGGQGVVPMSHMLLIRVPVLRLLVRSQSLTPTTNYHRGRQWRELPNYQGLHQAFLRLETRRNSCLTSAVKARRRPGLSDIDTSRY